MSKKLCRLSRMHRAEGGYNLLRIPRNLCISKSWCIKSLTLGIRIIANQWNHSLGIGESYSLLDPNKACFLPAANPKEALSVNGRLGINLAYSREQQ